MAGYSENRELNKDIKYLRKVLGNVDSCIRAPDSLRGDVLLQKLEGVTQEPSPEEKVRMIMPKRLFTLRSGLTYAAAFLLIVGLFYGMGFDKQNDMLTGEISLAPYASLPDTPLLDGGGGTEMARIAPESEEINPQANLQDSAPQENPMTFGMTVEEPAENPVTGGGVGGSGPSTRLGSYQDYILAFRPNDSTDPDHISEAPYLLELMKDDAMVAQVDIPFITEISGYYGDADILTLVGAVPEGTGSFVLNMADVETPAVLAYLTQPGTLREARVANGILHVLSYSPTSVGEPGDNWIALSGSADEGACTITAVDMTGGVYNQVTFTGVGEEIKLFNISAYLYFDGIPAEGEAPERNIAQVNLKDTEIELVGIS